MAVTAQLLIGNPHPNDGGLNIIDRIDLSEHDRPALTFRNIIRPRQNPLPRRATWIPTLENMLDDALLMAAVHSFEDESVRNLFQQYNKKFDENRLEIYRDLTAEQRINLYKKCQKIENFPKIILTIFQGSSIIDTIATLAHYKMECEVLTPIYSRTYSNWTNSMTSTGSLPFFGGSKIPHEE